MKTIAALLIAAGMTVSQCALADALQPGKYTGAVTVMGNRNIEQWGMAVQIDSVEQGVARGLATRYRGKCQGDVPVEGKLEGNTLTLRETAKGGRAGDCGFRATLTVDGPKLMGKMGNGDPVELSR